MLIFDTKQQNSVKQLSFNLKKKKKGIQGLLRPFKDPQRSMLLLLLLLLLLLSRFSPVRLCATPETAAHQALQALGFSRQEHWSGLPFPSLKSTVTATRIVRILQRRSGLGFWTLRRTQEGKVMGASVTGRGRRARRPRGPPAPLPLPRIPCPASAAASLLPPKLRGTNPRAQPAPSGSAGARAALRSELATPKPSHRRPSSSPGSHHGRDPEQPGPARAGGLLGPASSAPAAARDAAQTLPCSSVPGARARGGRTWRLRI